MIKKYFLLLLLTLGWNCTNNSSQPENIVVKYKNHILTQQDIKAILPNNYLPEDSMLLAENYITNWLKSKVMIEESTNILTKENKSLIDEKVDKYKDDLISSYLEKQWLENQRLDTVNEEEYKNYYAENGKNFQVNTDLVQYKYISVPNDSIQKAKRLFYSRDTLSQKKLIEWLKNNQYAYHLNDSNWVEFDQLKSTLGFPSISNNKQFLHRTKNLTTSLDNNIQYIQLIDYKLKGDIAPLKYVKPKIKNIIINKRKLNLLTQKKNELYEKALQNDEIERY